VINIPVKGTMVSGGWFQPYRNGNHLCVFCKGKVVLVEVSWFIQIM